MKRKKTAKLKVLTDQSLPKEELVINPNDGFDLGLMMTEAEVELILGSTFGEEETSITSEGLLVQKNECSLGTVMIAPKLTEKLGRDSSIYLYIEETEGKSKIFIEK